MNVIADRLHELGIFDLFSGPFFFRATDQAIILSFNDQLMNQWHTLRFLAVQR